ncbi:MAG: murein L,D-transpeptidase catalytic domain family protein [Psychrilyobacter sp.]|nr:murein L,D-transpeptidase catalytic domain family protein [Psychrilyobacter sp.]
MRSKLIVAFIFIVSTFSFGKEMKDELYKSLNAPTLNKNILDRALKGLIELNIDISKKNIITIIDYTKSANEKRLYIIDIKSRKVLYYTYVAHGENTGYEYARKFSNIIESHQSSVGFFITSNSYIGSKGYSMRMDGMENGINNNARVRNIVFHGADYVNKSYIRTNGRLGRSWGCPAVPIAQTRGIINTIKNGSLVYINGDLDNYKRRTKL